MGTAQSQSAMRQERIQHVPPHPSTGQRSQFQSQDVARASPVTQIGQGDQTMAKEKDGAHRQGLRGVSTPSHHRLSQRIGKLYRVRSCYLAYGQEYYLIMVHRIHSLLHQL